MGALSRLMENSILDVLAGRTASLSTAGQVWAQLHSGGSPGTDGTANVASGFSRQQLTWSTPASRESETTNDLVFANFGYQETGSPYISLWDASSGGSFLGADQVTPPEVIDIGQTWTIPAGQLVLSFPTGANASDDLCHRILNMLIGSSALSGTSTPPYLQLHSGDPGSDGNSNVITNAYGLSTGANGRMQSPSWNAPANGIIESGTLASPFGWELRGSAGVQIGITTYWDAATGGNYLGKRGTILTNPMYPGDRYIYSFAPSFNIPCRFIYNSTF